MWSAMPSYHTVDVRRSARKALRISETEVIGKGEAAPQIVKVGYI